MDEQLTLLGTAAGQDERVARIAELIPQPMMDAIAKIELIPMDKQSNGMFAGRACDNVMITLKQSAFYPTVPASGLLCKLITLPKGAQMGLVVCVPAAGCAFDLDQPGNVDRLRPVLVQVLEGLFPAHSFGCCASYRECSDAGHCVHVNPFYAVGCTYKAHLDAGEIFYSPEEVRS